jgi:hypothetical protein
MLHVNTNGNENALFDFAQVQLSTVLDKKEVSKPRDYLTAIATLVSVHWVFNVEFARSNSKTLQFLGGHVCKLMPFKVTPAMLKVTNFIYRN